MRCVRSKYCNFLGTGLGLHQRCDNMPLLQRRLLQATTATSSSSSPTTSTSSSAVELPYGLKRIDYSALPPLTYNSRPLYGIPPPPPHLYNPKNSIFTSTIQPMLAPFCVVLLIGSTIYLYLYPEEDVYEYWKQVEQGNVPVEGDDDDDDNDDDDDEWDDE